MRESGAEQSSPLRILSRTVDGYAPKNSTGRFGPSHKRHFHSRTRRITKRAWKGLLKSCPPDKSTGLRITGLESRLYQTLTHLWTENDMGSAGRCDGETSADMCAGRNDLVQ